LAGTFTGAIQRKVHENFGRKGSVSLFRDCPIVFDYPLVSQELVKLQTSNIAGTFTGPIGTKAL